MDLSSALCCQAAAVLPALRRRGVGKHLCKACPYAALSMLLEELNSKWAEDICSISKSCSAKAASSVQQLVQTLWCMWAHRQPMLRALQVGKPAPGRHPGVSD